MKETPIDILVSEVGPRDGLQSIQRAMPTEIKHRWIAVLAAAGLREIEVGSFVSPKLLPQMARNRIALRYDRCVSPASFSAQSRSGTSARKGRTPRCKP